MSISVLNKSVHGIAKDDIYIGRPSVLGNPFVIGADGSRDEVCDKYERWLRHQLNASTATGTNVRAAMSAIKVRATQGHVNLVCWCAPRRCHGDTIRSIIEQETTIPLA